MARLVSELNVLFDLVSGDDYVALSDSVVEFDGCQRSKCVTISIVNDLELEKTETFTISLKNSSVLGSTISLGTMEAEIQISDDDSQYSSTLLQYFTYCL